MWVGTVPTNLREARVFAANVTYLLPTFEVPKVRYWFLLRRYVFEETQRFWLWVPQRMILALWFHSVPSIIILIWRVCNTLSRSKHLDWMFYNLLWAFQFCSAKKNSPARLPLLTPNTRATFVLSNYVRVGASRSSCYRTPRGSTVF